MPSATLILCATSRLAQSLRWQHDRAQAAAGETAWPTLNTATVAQWFSTLVEEALLRGKAEGLLLRRALDTFQESLLWEQAIGESIPDYAARFFDLPGMAATAAEAHERMVTWGIAPAAAYAGGETGDETREFMRWRRRFLDLCHARDAVDSAQQRDAVLALIDAGAVALPREIFFAGFDTITPQERRLQSLLKAKGSDVSEWKIDGNGSPSILVCSLPAADGECRAAAQWAAAHLARNAAVQLGIVVPHLDSARDAIESALDEALYPALLRPACVEAPRCYNFSLGKPLARHPLAAAALDLIALACGTGEVEQSRIGELLRHPCWSAGIHEADARARLEALLREKLPATASVARVRALAQWFDQDNEIKALPQLTAHLVAIETTRSAWRNKALPSQWAARIRLFLHAAGWPGERTLSSHEFQARQAFFDELDQLARLDGIADSMPAGEAHRRLTQLCTAHVFQAEAAGERNIQIVGMLEAGGMHFDALWVMGMTDDVWPPMPRPNPLLPAELQRQAGAPNASAQVQLAFATSIHRRLLQCAPQVTFSFARRDGATELRPSPLLAPYLAAPVADWPDAAWSNTALASTPLPTGIWAEPIDDSLAPPVKDGEHVPGGTGLLKAQAICPAWACFRYRLGAKQLEKPVDGIDPKARGSIVHEALRNFWMATGSSPALRAMSDNERHAAIDLAVDTALAGYDDEHRAAPLPPVFRKLERERLQRLLSNWLAVELQRAQPFSVVSCEERIAVDIVGILCHLQIDRIDLLDDGRRIVIDYKTGAVNGYRSWADMRIAEPQLPIYAAIAQSETQSENDTAAVSFARVLLDDSTFVGIAAEDGLLPRVPGIDSKDGRKVFSADEFADWHAVLKHWRASIEDIAHEVKVGAAAVMVADEADLRYCDVLPLLRLAERRAQWEAETQSSGEGAP